jgi:hypothetical protein
LHEIIVHLALINNKTPTTRDERSFEILGAESREPIAMLDDNRRHRWISEHSAQFRTVPLRPEPISATVRTTLIPFTVAYWERATESAF